LTKSPRKSAPKKTGYVIGVTFFVNADGDPGLFENGFRQNVLFLYQMFKASPDCARVYLLNHGDGELSADVSAYGIDPADVVRTPTVMEQLDYVISAGAAVEPETLKALRDRGCKIVAYKAGNGGVISMEAIVAKPPRADAERYFDADCFDAIWLLPQHWHTYRGWCQTVYRCPVIQAPHIWNPLFIKTTEPEILARFGYRPGDKTWRIGVMDPNITIMKTSHMPMLVCEAAYRQRADAFAAFFISNGWPHKDNPHFENFTLSLSAARSGKMTLEPRFRGSHFLANHCDAVVTHQWENGLNYLYYEVLFGGYPLIHNSKFIQEFGYYYADFDPHSGAAALLRAVDEHDDNFAAYNERSRVLIDSMEPTSKAMIYRHETMLKAL